MYRLLQKVEKYKGKFPLITFKEAHEKLGWEDTAYAAVSNNGFLDAYLDGKTIKFPLDHVKALTKCDRGALMFFQGADALVRNASIFESELEKLNHVQTTS